MFDIKSSYLYQISRDSGKGTSLRKSAFITTRMGSPPRARGRGAPKARPRELPADVLAGRRAGSRAAASRRLRLYDGVGPPDELLQRPPRRPDNPAGAASLNLDGVASLTETAKTTPGITLSSTRRPGDSTAPPEPDRPGARRWCPRSSGRYGVSTSRRSKRSDAARSRARAAAATTARCHQGTPLESGDWPTHQKLERNRNGSSQEASEKSPPIR